MEYTNIHRRNELFADKLRNVKIIRLELVAGLMGVAVGLTAVINTNLYIVKICRNNLNYTEYVCDNLNLGIHEEEQNQVQTQATLLSMYATLLANIPIIFITLLCGPKATSLGKKVVLGVPLLGFTISQGIVLINIFFWHARAEYLLFSSVYALFGGSSGFFLGIYSLTAASTLESSRTARISVIDASVSASISLGIFMSAYIFSSTGYTGIYSCALGILLVDFLLVIFLLKEDIQPYPELSPIQPVSMATLCSGLVWRRSSTQRSVVFLLILAMLLFVAMLCGDVSYLYTRKVLDWDEQSFTKVSSMSTLINCGTSFLLLPFLSYYLELPDTLLGWAAGMSATTSSLVIALARDGVAYTFGVVLNLLSPVATVVIRSLLSKLLPKEELGTMYSLLSGLENILPLALIPLVTLLYNSTLNSCPQTVFFVRCGMGLMFTLVFILIHFLLREGTEPLLLVDNTPYQDERDLLLPVDTTIREPFTRNTEERKPLLHVDTAERKPLLPVDTAERKPLLPVDTAERKPLLPADTTERLDEYSSSATSLLA